MAGLVAALLLAGCGMQKPRGRMGCLPFPGPFTLFELADPDDLGQHRYSIWPRFRDDEQERGIVYTRRAGLLDIAHLRKTVDWTRYVHDAVRPALAQGETEVTMWGRELSHYRLTFSYPPGWFELPPAERARREDALAIAIGQRVAHVMVTWHEIVTWFGYRSTVLISEEGSAFTYDDGISHLVGLWIAEAALRDRVHDYDTAVTLAFNDVLCTLEVVDSDEAMDAIYAVQGHWWSGITTLKRDLQTGLDGAPVRPWRIGPDAVDDETFTAPTLDPSVGVDLAGFLDIEIDTIILEAGRMRDCLDPRPDHFRPEHFPQLLAVIREQMMEEFGEGFDLP